MAAINEPYPFSSFPLTSYETALCIIPPLHQCNEIDRLRNLYDKAWGRWPPHINLIYPFVSPNLLPQAKAMVEAKLASVTLSSNAIILNAPGTSSHRANHTVFLSEATTSSDNSGPLAVLRSAVLEVLGQPTSPSKFHLTVGQPVDETDSTKNFLLSKVGLLPEFEVPIQYLVILLRERTSTRTQDPGVIRLWCTIDIPGNCLGRPTSSMSEFWLPVRGKSESQIQSELDDGTLQVGTTETLRDVYLDHGIQSGTTYQYNTSGDNWTPCLEPISPITAGTRLKVSSYNVLKDSVHPPALERDAMLLQAILSEPASSDILVLQEVSDPFLTYLLSVAQIQRQYPFVSHGPPHQQNIGLLPSLHNVLVLSRYHFTWELIPFRRGHKGASVAIFNFNRENNSPLERLIVAGIHLTYDLTDESVAAKKTQLHDLVKHLNQHYPKEPWIIAGDFNISTSSHTISTAVQNRAISRQTTITLASIEMMLADAGLVDTWSISRVEDADETATNSEELCEGEDGATFNPMEKRLAAAISGTSSNRPERYDRILARCQNTLRITHFNQFGLDDHDGVQVAPSDHYGIRATINVVAEGNPRDEPGMLKKRSVIAKRVPAQLAESSALESTLANHHMLPTAEEIELRKKAFSLLKEVLLGFSVKRRPELSDVPLVIVPVGSYALGVWTSASDIDCLCIGSISSTTFFSMARHRIRRAEPRGIRLLRKVEANTGTMYELSVNGINMHMQYCPAAQIVERWSELPSRYHSDPIFDLPISSLRKLKPYRDLAYIQRTLPSQATFRLAHRCIKLWAIQQGVYSSKFGFLSGIHITLMLAWICKRLAHDVTVVSAAEVVATFFRYYAKFDWKNDLMFDAFFHKQQPRYHRSAREPMVVLGYHAPNTNISHTSTVPGLNVLVKEFERADLVLSEPNMTWDRFFNASGGSHAGVAEFLDSHDSYARINVHYWGRSLSKGMGLVGWVESRCVSLVVEINKYLPDIEVRIWPARFTNDDSSDSELGYHGYYLIGMSKGRQSDSYATKEDKLHAKQALEKVTTRFIDQLHSDEKYYDAATIWIDIAVVKPSEVQNLVIDEREWGEYIPDLEPDSDDEDEEDPEDLIEGSDIGPTRSHKLPRPGPAESAAPLAADVAKSKLRPASDVLSRLRWDPQLSPSDYIVGYEDRFLGAKEMSLEKWKSESTDDEFIPLHRILYFRRRVDGVVVWDRRSRVDKVFGSGIRDGK